MSSNEGRPAGGVIASGGMSWTRVRTPRVLSQIAKALLAIGALSTMMVAHEDALLAQLSTVGPTLAILLFITSYMVSLAATAFAGTLEIHPDHLAIQTATDRIVIRNEKIRSAMVVERPSFQTSIDTVEIELTNGDLLVTRLPEPGAASKVVEALGFGAGGGRVHATLAKPTRRLLHPLVGLVCSLVAIGIPEALGSRLRVGGADLAALAILAYPLFALVLYAAGKRLMRPLEITVGDDGVLVKLRLETRFIPRRDIAFVGAAFGTKMFIETRSGERIRVGGMLLLDDARRIAIARVIEERAGPAAAGAERFANYERGGRALPAWRAHLGHAMHGASYRMNAATVDEAAAVLRSAQATAEQRVGAALALRIAGQPKESILVAADAAVDDRIREALEAVVESEDDVAIEKVLRRLP